MRFVLYTHTFSPHEMPFFKACAELFGEAVYVVDVPWRIDPSRKGWSLSDEGLKTVILEEIPPGERRSFMRQILGGDSVLLYGQRRNPYMDVIATTPRVVVYASERWLKPDARYLFGKVRIPIPGIFHFFQGAFLSDVLRYGRLLAKNPRFFYFGQGVHAVGDMAKLALLSHGNLSYLFRKFPVRCPAEPTQMIDFCAPVLRKIRTWGYFVDASKDEQGHSVQDGDVLRVLWIGRVLQWKRVDVVVAAVRKVHARLCRGEQTGYKKIELDVYGRGQDEERVKRLASGDDYIRFHDFIDMSEVRAVMRRHDLFVMASDAHEGWGVVVNEALLEGMSVVSSRQAGAGATMLPEECLFETGDVDALSEKIWDPPAPCGIGSWNVREAARRFRAFVQSVPRM